uniref:ATP synthase subunit b', chloroplastic n=1 Tax=Kalanchoe fedtschenkoi TaxID=63787 RepID=A0A7N0U8A7_KALFE
MANVIMASCSKALIPTSKPKSPQFQLSLPKFQTLAPKIPKPQISISPSAVKSLVAAAAAGLALAPPSLAEEMHKAALFDFNLTLPIMMAEFLLLMVALDKVYYTPLGKFMDERDAMIKAKLSEVKDTSSEIKAMEEQMAAIMKAARAEISAALNKMKKETAAEVEQKIAEGRKKVEAELQEALANLERQKAETIKALDSQIAALSDEIVKKVLPI